VTTVASADITRLANAMRESAHDANITTQQVMIESANYLLSEMQARVPVDTGELRSSLTVKVEQNRVLVGPTAAYAPYVEFGTKPHEIKPKNAGGVLVFNVGGRKVFAKKVNHPGTKAQPFVRPAYEAWVGSVAPLVGKANVKNLVENA